MATKPQVIALEEHYLDPEVKPHIAGRDQSGGAGIAERLDDVGQGRIAEMDAAGIDIQVLSHGAPSVQKIEDAELAVPAGARRQRPAGRDRRARTPTASPPLPTLPTADPKAAADELERAVTQLGFKGAMIHGLTNGRVPRRPAVLADLRARRRRWTCRLYLHPAVPASGGDRRLLPGLRRRNTRASCAPPGASRWRPRRRASAWC